VKQATHSFEREGGEGVPIKPSDHEQLLKLLRRLNQRIEFPLVLRWDRELCSAARCPLEQGRGLDFEKVVTVGQDPPSKQRQRGPHAQCPLHLDASQVEVAILLAEQIVCEVVPAAIWRERETLRNVKDGGRLHLDLDCPRGHLVIRGLGGPLAHNAGDAHHRLGRKLLNRVPDYSLTNSQLQVHIATRRSALLLTPNGAR
jgi:hypothetical protein